MNLGNDFYALKEEVKSLKELRDSFGNEIDQLNELCHAKDITIQQLEQQNKNMDNKISRLQPQVELIASLEDRINFLEKQCDQFAKELRESSNKCATAEGNLSVALYARNDAYNKLDLMQNNLDHLQTEFLKASRRAQDELDMHDQTRMRLEECERESSREISALKTRMREMENILEEERKACRIRIEQKEQEKRDQILMFDQFKDNMEERNQQTQNELNSTKEALNDLGKKHKNAIEENKQLEAKFTEMKDKHSKLWEDIGKAHPSFLLNQYVYDPMADAPVLQVVSIQHNIDENFPEPEPIALYQKLIDINGNEEPLGYLHIPFY